MLFKRYHNQTTLDSWFRAAAENVTLGGGAQSHLLLTNDNNSSSSSSRGKYNRRLIRAGIRIANLVPDDSGLYTVQASLLDGLLTANLSLRLRLSKIVNMLK